MKIASIALENVKKVRCVTLEPSPSGLTVIGGNNGEGKTSVLDAIAYALGGENYRPSNLKREESLGDPIIHIETDDGLIIERKGKNSDLRVTDSTGRRAGQTLLNTLVGRLSIDLPKFINANSKDKAKMLLQIIGVGEELSALDKEYKAKFDTRLIIGRERDIKKKAAEDMPYHEDAPEKPVSVSDLLKSQQDLIARNARIDALRAERERIIEETCRVEAELDALEKKLEELKKRAEETEAIPEKESTEELERQIAEHEEINAKVRENEAKRAREQEAVDLSSTYDNLTGEMKEIERKRLALLSSKEMPLEGLSVSSDGDLLLNGKSWDCMSGSQQLIVAASIASKMNPNCGFVLMDKMEQFDLKTLSEFGSWLEERNLQVICTRVSTGDECTIILSDGVSEPIEKASTESNQEDY